MDLARWATARYLSPCRIGTSAQPAGNSWRRQPDPAVMCRPSGCSACSGRAGEASSAAPKAAVSASSDVTTAMAIDA